MPGEFGLWVGFGTVVSVMLILDLTVFHRRAHTVSFKEAGIWTVVWVGLALCFGIAVYAVKGAQPAVDFLTGYLIEEALSIDNIFVFVLIFALYQVPGTYQHRVLAWGVLGAIVMRGCLIAVGATLLHRFEWVLYAFGAFLILTGLKMAFQRSGPVNLKNGAAVRLVRRLVPVADDFDGQKFISARGGRRLVTPLLLVLVLIECSDLVFAVDSIPAIFAVTRDPFVVYTSNVFAILGLRQLYFMLAGMVNLFRFLKTGLAVVLMFVGLKMLLSDVWAMPTVVSLGVVLGVLLASVVLSVLVPERKAQRPAESALGAAGSITNR